jgi:hypothetical protein
MNPPLTANQLRGRASGTLFFAGFGTVWIGLALYARQEINAMSASTVLLCLAVLVIESMRLFRESKRLQRVPDDPAISHAFRWIHAMQWIAIFAVVYTLGKLHLEVYLMNAITAIVGLHMFPLARLFRYPMHHATGAVLVAWAAGSIFMAPLDQLQGVTAMGTGVILWISAGITLGMAFGAAHKSTDLQMADLPRTPTT